LNALLHQNQSDSDTRIDAMLKKLSALHPNFVRVLIAVGTLTMFVLSAGAPRGYGG
jgi:hypothetical protein